MLQFMRDLPAWGISLVINLSLLAVFHFIVLESIREPVVNTITSKLDTETPEKEFNFSERISEEVGNEGSTAAMTATLKSATALGANDTPLLEKVEEVLNPQIPMLSETAVVKLEGDITKSVEIKGHSDRIAGGVEGAMDRAAFEIRQSLRERKTLVIWLFDSSQSLNNRRQKISERFENIYRQLGKSGSTEGLYSVVATYQQRAELLTPDPVQDVAVLTEIVRKKIKPDANTDLENVFGTVRMVVEKYRTFRRNDGPWNKLIFIVTDERGDDAEQHLEDAIALARRSQTKVYCIGNAAIFGRKEGYHRWVYEDGFAEDIPVDQGPETAFPEAVQLPFLGSGADWRLKQMSSSYGPYALTRLCSETGGMYLITEDSRGYSFDSAVMRRYAPDYRPVRQQEAEVSKHPSKASLVTAAGLTYGSDLPIPKLTFRAYNDNILRNDLNEAQRPVAEIEFSLRRLFETLAVGEAARPTLREDRWRAAYDLAIGRVLAMRVRYFGYNQMLANMKVTPKSFEKEKSNMWRLVPSSDIDSGPQMRKAAEQAKMYLQRVLDEHPGTPWAMLAERELSHDLGWSWQEYSEPIAGSNQLRASQEEVARLLLADEERRQEMQKKAEAPRVRPKL